MGQNIKFDANGKILGWRELVTPIKSDNVYRDGPAYLTDLRDLLSKFSFEETYAYSTDMLTMELFVVLISETAIILASCAALTILVVFLITGAPRLAAIIGFTTILTNYFLLGLIPLVGLTFNNVVSVYLITSIGLSVLYSVQVSHTFLLVQADKRM